MVDLIAKSPCDGLLPLTIGTTTLTEETSGALTSIGPLKGQEKALSAALKKAHGMAAPAPGRATGKAGERALWFGNRMILLQGPATDAALADHAAVVDQSDAWAVVNISGAGAVDVLARLVPLDLRAGTFKRGHTARSQLGHMNASITRTGPESFQIMVFRSMAGTLLHDLKQAMAAVASRG